MKRNWKLLLVVLAIAICSNFADVQAANTSITKKKPHNPVSEKMKKEMHNTLRELKETCYFKERVSKTTEQADAKKLQAEMVKVVTLQYELNAISKKGTRKALNYVIDNYPKQCAYARTYLSKFEGKLKRIEQLKPALYKNDATAIVEIESILKEHRAVLLKNPILDNKEILAVRQIVPNATQTMARGIGRNNNNWTTNATIRRKGWNNEICKITNLQTTPKLSTVYKPEAGAPVKDIDIDWNANKILFSTVAKDGRWHVCEMDLGNQQIKQLTPSKYGDIDFFDACYLPDGNIILATTAGYVGVPCITGSAPASDLFHLNTKTSKLRQLNFGQDCDWNPVVLNSGRVCYLRWEYTDNSHYFTRILMHMNPDGTAKKEYYGSGSYFPNSMFDTRPIPGKNGEFITIVSGHHGIARSGRLMIFDPKKGRKEADGVIQEIPYSGKEVKPIIKDRLVNGVWPQFLTPYPVNDNFFLVSAKLGPNALWGIYLVDRFDNMTLVHNANGEAFIEPYLLEKRPVPPTIPEKVKLEDKTSTIYISDIYEGQGLKGIPRGKVKKLRIYAYQFGYNKVGGHDVIGFEGGWDVKRILGTVPVEADGSAIFKVPANTPISLQPLDENGAALQLMRSWLTGMPGEVVSCVGCHESQNQVPPAKFTAASRKAPSQIKPWYGPARPVAYETELKPVIDKKCVACHNGTKSDRPDFSKNESCGYKNFSKSYMALHPYVRRPGCESDFHTLEPMDYYYNTSELVQMLKKGHHGVELNDEEWDRLITWIDMNVPYNGKYQAPEYCGKHQPQRREELAQEFGNVHLIGEDEFAQAQKRLKAKGEIEPELPKKHCLPNPPVSLRKWPLTKDAALKLQQKYAVKGAITKTVKLAEGVELEFVRIPAGKYVMGDANGQADQKERIVKINKPFWMAKTEITNKMLRTVFADHNSRFIDQQWKDHIFAGYPANKDQMPAIRVTWERANAYCKALSKKTGLRISLPTEEQWEWAARAGSDTDMYYGDANSDFSKYENLADYTLRDLAVVGVDPKPMGAKNWRFKFYNFVPKDERFNDGVLVPQSTGAYKANAWGLHDMLGNVAEWTKSDYSSWGEDQEMKVARGGSWRDRPAFSTVATRDGYLPYQKVFNVGIRLIIEE